MNLEGKKAPNFELQDQNDQTHKLSDYQGKWVLIYFYPKDMTSGCTVEAERFRDMMEDFEAMDVQVLGVSCDDVKSHQKFADKHDLNFPLLADTEKQMVQDYKVWVEKSMYGKKYMGIQRDSFLINPDGNIEKHYEKVKPKNHPEEVLTDIKKLSK